MTNEFGVKLDANGYAPSIMQPFEDKVCFLCEASGDLARHEVFNAANRQKSKALGVWVSLCPRCHMEVHEKPSKFYWMKASGQLRCMAQYDWTFDDFRMEFGKSYV